MIQNHIPVKLLYLQKLAVFPVNKQDSYFEIRSFCKYNEGTKQKGEIMMANFFDSVIEDLKKANGGNEDEVIIALRAKRDELGEDASEAEMMSAVRECLMARLTGAMGGNDDDSAVVLSEKDKAYMENATSVVKAFLDENHWHYGIHELRKDLVLYELGFGVKGVNLRIRIHVEADPDVCRIDAVLPISADSTYEYPLCKMLAKENYARRFGSFKYDERDGEITYEYSFLARHGILKDDLETYFHAVVRSAISCYDDIRKCCVGRFKGKEVDEILQKVNDLISDING